MLLGLRRKRDRWWCNLGDGSSRVGTAGPGAAAPAGDRVTKVRLSGDAFTAAARRDDELSVVVERSGSALVVSAHGSVDASNVGTWRRLVGDAAGITAPPGPLIVDASRLEFMAVCAFAVLAEESAGCLYRGVDLCLVSDQPLARRVVAATGLDAALTLYSSIDEALRSAAGA